MSSLSIIIVIAVVLVVCVVAITVIQKKEQEKALLRQKISQYRYRANQASNILNNFSQLPIGSEARQILMLLCLANLEAIIKLDPNDVPAQQSIETLKTNISSPQTAADTQRLKIPSDLDLMTKQISQLSTLAKFILKQHKTHKTVSKLAPVAINKIMALISESKVCAYIQQGRDSLIKHQYVPAQRSFIMAQQMMLKIKNKNDRIKQLEVELQELIKSTPAEVMNTQLSIEEPEYDTPPKEGDLFGPRKKW
jgi:hypothetical protein